jgi:glycosyltransferase involved in cell wall biosynthesis
MNVLWCSDPPSAPTGLGNITRAVCGGLARLGHRVTTFGGRASGESGGITVHRGDGRKPDPDALARLLGALRPDVLVTAVTAGEAHAFADAAITRARRAARIPWVVYCTVDCDRGDGRLPAATARALGAADLLLVMSRYAVRIARASGLLAVRVPAGVDTRVFRPPLVRGQAKRALGYRGRFVVLYDARNQIRKLLPRTLEAFRRFACGKRDVLLHLHCDPYDPEAEAEDYCYDLRSDVVLLGLAERVRFTRGMSMRRGLSLARLATLYHAADVHLLTSWGEGFGMPGLQAAAAGVVPIAPACASNPELVARHGELVRVRSFTRTRAGERAALVDVDDVVATLERLYRDGAAREAKARAARRFAEGYAWERVVRRWHELLERQVPRLRARVLQRRGRRAGDARRSDGTARRSDRLTIPVTLPPADPSRTRARITGRVFLAGRADVPVFLALRRVFRRLSAWSAASMMPGTGSFRCDRVRRDGRAFADRLATTTLAIDLDGVEPELPRSAAVLAVPSIGSDRNAEQRRLWPALTLPAPDVARAAEIGRRMLTDPCEAADACALARKRASRRTPVSLRMR